jgi:hypothetical protein
LHKDIVKMVHLLNFAPDNAEITLDCAMHFSSLPF